jgi:tRNA pseudouridine13 synthase
VAFAGTKDRRGVTVQRACIKGVRVERVNGLNKTLRGIKLGSFKYEPAGITLGDLSGNEFYITIRDVKSEG